MLPAAMLYDRDLDGRVFFQKRFCRYRIERPGKRSAEGEQVAGDSRGRWAWFTVAAPDNENDACSRQGESRADTEREPLFAGTRAYQRPKQGGKRNKQGGIRSSRVFQSVHEKNIVQRDTEEAEPGECEAVPAINVKGLAAEKHHDEKKHRGKGKADHGECEGMEVRKRKFDDRKVDAPDKGDEQEAKVEHSTQNVECRIGN